MSNKIAVIDTHKTGHHLEYVYGVCQGMAKKDKKIDIYCNQAFYSYQKDNNLKDQSNSPNIKLLTGYLEEPEGNWIKKTTIAYRNIKKISQYNEVIFLSINVYFVALLLHKLISRANFRVGGIYFKPFIRKSSSRKSWLKIIILKLLIKAYSSLKIFVLNDSEAVNKLNKLFNTQSFYVIQDPIPDFYYEQLKDKPPPEASVLMYTLIGSISKRKGVFELLRAIELSNSSNQFLIIGSVEKDIKSRLESEIHRLTRKGFNITLVDKFLSNTEFASFIYQSDVILLTYLTTGASSGILGHAAFAKKPVIGPHTGLLNKLIEKYELGISINPENHIGFSDLLAKEKLDIDFGNKALRKEYVQKHSQKRFISTLFQMH